MYASKRSLVFSLAPLLFALSAFPQAGVASIDRANQLGEEGMRLMREKQIFAVLTFNIPEYSADRTATSAQGARERQMFDLEAQQSPATNQPSDEGLRGSKPADLNRDIYYKNKLEFSLDGGWLPINIPFPFDVFEGDPYKLYPLRYTLVPITASLRWHMTDIGGPRILRGNWDLTCSGSVTFIPRGPETRYFSYIMGIRRNFVPRNWRVAPYWDIRLGLGDIDAKGPDGVKYAQGQDFTFTANMGSGVRYNFNPRFAISAGLNYMHISNAGLSGKSTNYGINVYGPMFGIDIRLRRHQRHSEQ